MRRGTIDPPELDELLPLNSWPEGTFGYGAEEYMIRTLHVFCELHGYGRVQQVVQAIHDVWRDPTLAERFERDRVARLDLLKRGAEKV